MNRPEFAKDILVAKLVTLSPQTPVFEGIGCLLHANVTGAPVIDDEENYLGVFSEKCCMRILSAAARAAAAEGVGLGDLPRAKQVMATHLVTLTPEMDAFDAINLLLRHRVSAAPVVDGQRRFVGVFSEKTSMTVLLNAAYDQLPTSTVGAFMDTDRACCIAEDKDLLSMARIFLDTPCRQLPVLREDVLQGQVSRRDVLRAAFPYSRDASHRQAALSDWSVEERLGHPVQNEQVASFMDRAARTVTEDLDILTMAQVFRTTPYRRLPVLREAKLVGQVSRRDLLQAVNDWIAISPHREKTLLYLSALVPRQDAPIL
jgi:CBS domain-containing protein